MSDLVGNPEDRFSHNEARIISPISISELSKFYLVTEAAWVDVRLTLLINHKDNFAQDNAQNDII